MSRQGLAFLKELNHPAVGLLLDTFHVNIEESSWSEPFRQAIAGREALPRPPGRQQPSASRAGPDRLWRHPVRPWTRSGYTGWLSAELLGKPDPDTAGQQTIEYMLNLMKVLA